MIDFIQNHTLMDLREQLNQKERHTLSPFASFSNAALRRQPETKVDHRQEYALDCDRILHSRAYTRYIDKTQVFSLISNDHITHRVLHVQLVARIARTVGRFIGLNEDLIEAIALGHDIGHPPYGHDGERVLSELCQQHGLPPFHHNIQSVRFLDRIEKRGGGWNLTLQTLDGILCHDGESHSETLQPCRGRNFADLEQMITQLETEPQPTCLFPMTLEGCLVRLCDTIGYIGRDIEDAIELGLIHRNDLPESATEILGNTNGTIVYRLVADLIQNGCSEDNIRFSAEIGTALRQLKRFNYERIYLNPVIKRGFDKISLCYQSLFETYCDDLRKGQSSSLIFIDFFESMGPGYRATTETAAMVRDFIAGMTDAYFLTAAAALGCRIPTKIPRPIATKKQM
ncbi:MAG: HD domain-containing protein [Proteobacteria bacterium]|nr:HD domain-containing protein [Pseudomonadota bacterium]MBU1688439.1 HD domain-containing protein [Pseudomonadota bacterium]